MKYLTPELLARTRSLDDDAADSAAVEWEQALAAYHSGLQTFRRNLPLGARQLLRHASLHDARLLTINRTGTDLFLTFRLAKAAHKLGGGVELRYRLADQSKLVIHQSEALPNGPSTRWVLYDEWDQGDQGTEQTFTHSLLMTGGLEMRIKFRNLQLRWFGRVLLADSKPSEIETELADGDHPTTTSVTGEAPS
jgi:hypothetical protein